MAFRADEAAQDGFEQAKRYLVSQEFDADKRKQAQRKLEELVDIYGPVVRGYPTWHPLVPQSNPRAPVTTPSDQHGYVGLDHTVCFAHAFLSCPYDDGRRILESVEKMAPHLYAEVTVERLDVSFYNSGTTAILVRCDWHQNLFQHMVPKSLAVPLMIQEEMRAWPGAELAERWETMAPYFLGSPHGARSSLFVSQDTAMAMKKAYMALVESGMFGPLRMD